MALALTIHEDGLCAKCGHPRDRSWNEDMSGLYTAHRATCQGCDAAHNEQEIRALRPAETVYVTDDAPAGFVPDPRMLDR